MTLNKEEAKLLIEFLRANNVSIPYSHWREIVELLTRLETLANSE